MSYMAYCLKFVLFAKHYIKENKDSIHAHTWRLAIYIGANGKFEYFNNLEKSIKMVLEGYTNIVLNDHEDFKNIEPIMENIGEVLFKALNSSLKKYDMNIDKLEISETPTRIYVVRDKEKKDEIIYEENFSSHLLKGILNYPIDTLMSKLTEENTKERQEEIPIVMESVTDDLNEESHYLKKEYKNISLKTVFAFIAILVIGALILFWVNLRGYLPWGSDAFGHIFKADLLYKSMKEGVYFPLYTDLWYNGIQPFRYWAPVPYYILAALQYVAGGDPILAYNFFIYLSFVLGAFGWLLWGICEKRLFFSTVMGILWFCFPDNIRVFFSEGNIPRAVIGFILPYMFFFIWQYINKNKKIYLAAIILTMTLICLCHLMVAAMLGITTFIYLFFYSLRNEGFGNPINLTYNFMRGKRVNTGGIPLYVILGMLLGISLSGVWSYPALQGGLMSMDADSVGEVMKSLTYKFYLSLNPFLRYTNIEVFYFGISFIIIATFGVFLSNRRSEPGFLTLLVVYLGTTTVLVPILIKLPFNQLLWIMRFTPIAYAIFTVSMILWRNARRYILLIICLILIVDSGISFKLLAFNVGHFGNNIPMYTDAAEKTSQRISIMDGSEFGSQASFFLCKGENPKAYAYGWAWQGASTAQNIVLLNTALDRGYYDYMFDRNLELGCDTVLVKKSKVDDFDKLVDAAKKSDYNLIKEYDLAYLFKRETPPVFGVRSKYYGLAIGSSAADISLQFPGYQIGNSLYIDDYTYEELIEYEMVYVSGFQYNVRSDGENLLYKIAEAGVKVIVDMNRVPYDDITKRMTFMSVTAQPIQFENRLPDLHIEGHAYFPTSFKEENRNWNTVYLENVPNPTGFSWMGGNKLVFIGKDENPNITYVGFNLLYHGMINEDNMAIDIYAGIMGRNAETLPVRQLIPMTVNIEPKKITINSKETDFNTTFAYLDAFKSEQENYIVHNLLNVTEEVTEIEIIYPYIGKGIIISIVGLFLTICLFAFIIYNERSL